RPALPHLVWQAPDRGLRELPSGAGEPAPGGLHGLARPQPAAAAPGPWRQHRGHGRRQLAGLPSRWRGSMTPLRASMRRAAGCRPGLVLLALLAVLATLLMPVESAAQRRRGRRGNRPAPAQAPAPARSPNAPANAPASTPPGAPGGTG